MGIGAPPTLPTSPVLSAVRWNLEGGGTGEHRLHLQSITLHVLTRQTCFTLRSLKYFHNRTVRHSSMRRILQRGSKQHDMIEGWAYISGSGRFLTSAREAPLQPLVPVWVISSAPTCVRHDVFMVHPHHHRSACCRRNCLIKRRDGSWSPDPALHLLSLVGPVPTTRSGGLER